MFNRKSRPYIRPDYVPTREIIGHGRTGPVFTVKLKNGEIAAMKAADSYNREYLCRELLDEARVLYYAQALGLQCTPKIYLSGHIGACYANIIEYLDDKTYYRRKKYKDMSHVELRMLRSALTELASHSIVHNDMAPKHVYFARDGSRCVIIDYGFGEIKPNGSKLEIEMCFDDLLPVSEQESRPDTIKEIKH